MKHSALALAMAAGLLSAGAFAQTRGEANYEEQCMRQPPAGSAAEQAAQRQRCIDEAKKAAKTDVPGEANQPGTTAAAGKKNGERAAARAKRRAEGATVAKQAKQDPKRPDQ